MCGGSGGGGRSGRTGGGSTNGDAGQPGEVVRAANELQSSIMQLRNARANLRTAEALRDKALTSGTAEQRKASRQAVKDAQKRIGEVQRTYREKTGKMLVD